MTRSLPRHPEFRKRFRARIYSDGAASEFAPFASDEGSDLLVEWAGRTAELSDASTVRQILLDDASASDDVVISAGFVLLRLTGQIDPEGREAVLNALYRSRRQSPWGQGAFDVMIADLGGVVPAGPVMSDELREMVDPDFGPPRVMTRTDWLATEAVRWNLPPSTLLPTKYLQHLGRLRRQLNADPDWRRWWDGGFPDEEPVLRVELRWGESAPRSSVRSSVTHGLREVSVVVGISLGALDELRSANSHGSADQLSFADLATAHVEIAFDRVSAKYGHPGHPPLSR